MLRVVGGCYRQCSCDGLCALVAFVARCTERYLVNECSRCRVAAAFNFNLMTPQLTIVDRRVYHEPLSLLLTRLSMSMRSTY